MITMSIGELGALMVFWSMSNYAAGYFSHYWKSTRSKKQ